MKTKHNSDLLDQKIDALLARRPVMASDDFASRVLAAAEADDTARSTKRPLGTLIKFALPLAAAVAVTISLLQFNTSSTEPAEGTALSASEAQEIFLLEESLASLATISTTEFGTEDLLSTLDALYLEI